MPHFINYLHIVFRTKCSEKSINPQHAGLLYAYMKAIVENHNCKVLRLNGMPDHVHMAISLAPDVAAATLMREVKSNSSVWMKANRDKFPLFEGWARSYFASSFSAEVAPNVIGYISNQQEHHRRRTFAEEVALFFERSGMKGGETYFLKDD